MEILFDQDVRLVQISWIYLSLSQSLVGFSHSFLKLDNPGIDTKLVSFGIYFPELTI